MARRVTVTLDDGTEIRGDPTSDEFLATIKAVGGDGIVYYSEKDGATPIANMNVHHAQNAVLKMMREAADRLQAHLAEPKEFRDGIIALFKNRTLLALIAHIEANIK